MLARKIEHWKVDDFLEFKETELYQEYCQNLSVAEGCDEEMIHQCLQAIPERTFITQFVDVGVGYFIIYELA